MCFCKGSLIQSIELGYASHITTILIHNDKVCVCVCVCVWRSKSNVFGATWETAIGKSLLGKQKPVAKNA